MNAEEQNLLHELDLALVSLAREVSREDVQHLLEASSCNALNKIKEIVLPDFSQQAEHDNVLVARWALTAYASDLHYTFADSSVQKLSPIPMLSKVACSQELALAA
jgi:hypothetical protein